MCRKSFLNYRKCVISSYGKMIFLRIPFYFRKLTRECSTNVNWKIPVGMETEFCVHHTVTKDKVPLVIKNANLVSWYICGPTVYDSAHIGHACTYLRFDIVRRILQKHLNIPVVQVMCVTNIDDKIIARSAETGVEWETLTRSYEKEFFDEMLSLNIIKPTIIARATDYIPHMIKFIGNLVEKNLAYKSSDGSVYFSMRNYAKGGKFREIDVTKNISKLKKCDADFALWKSAKPSEPFWESPWGPGRPGWHIECSAIASAYFGDSLDIHSGGYDLIFPHHENEEIQCCGYYDIDQWANYWLHTGQLYQAHDNQKMSKSLKNTESITNVLHSYTHNHFRMLCFMMNYRTNIQFSYELLDTSKKIYAKFSRFLDECANYIRGDLNKGDINEAELLKILACTKYNVKQALQDDFDTETCLSSLLHLVNVTNKMLSLDSATRNPVAISVVYSYILDTLFSFGFSFSAHVREIDSKAMETKAIIDVAVRFRDQIRKTALACKRNQINFEDGTNKLLKLCDETRQEFDNEGVHIKDHKSNSTWSYAAEKEK